MAEGIIIEIRLMTVFVDSGGFLTRVFPNVQFYIRKSPVYFILEANNFAMNAMILTTFVVRQIS